MEIRKETEVMTSGVPTEAQLQAINAQAKAKLTQEQVYVFSVRLCDDQVDRDYERFDKLALTELAKLFIGTTGIVEQRQPGGKSVCYRGGPGGRSELPEGLGLYSSRRLCR